MNVLPVIGRELRAQARQGMTYGVRVVAAGVLMLMFWGAMALGPWGQPARLGRDLFLALNGAVYYLIWLGVPLLVADAISGEKREGTLGLLFLTPLEAVDVVLGKGAILGMRAAGLLVAGLPVLVLPFLLGGVSGRHAAFMVVAHGVSLVCALAAGLAASALSRRMMRAVMAAVLLSGLLSLGFNAGLMLLFGGQEEGYFFGPLALAEGMEGWDKWAGARSRWWAGVPAAVLLLVAAAFMGQVVRQVEAFWQDAPVTTGRAQAAVARWCRMAARLVALVAVVLVVAVMQGNVEQAAFLVLGTSSVALSVSLWFGGTVAVIQRSADEARLEAAGPSSEHGVEGRAVGATGEVGEGRKWLRPVRAAWWGLVWLGFLLFLGSAVGAGVVTGRKAVVVMVGHLSAAVLAFGCGRLAWAWGRSWVRALVRGALVVGPMLVLWCLAYGAVMGQVMATSYRGAGSEEIWRQGVAVVVFVGSMVGSGAWLGFGWEPFERFDESVWLLGTVFTFLGSAGVSLGLCMVAAVFGRRSRGRVEDDPGAALRADLSEPLFARSFLARRRRRVLDRNPMRWLLDRSRLGRLHRAGWLAAVTVGETVMATEAYTLSMSEAWAWQGLFLFALALGLAVAAGMSFQEEKRTGALELILVTPLTAGQVVWGRWRGLLGQFLPALGLIAGVGYLTARVGYGGWAMPMMPAAVLLGGIASFVSVPPVGMLSSLALRNLGLAWLVTMLVPVGNGVLAAVFFYIGTGLGRGWGGEWFLGYVVGVGGVLLVANVGLAWVATRVLLRQVRR